MQQAHAAKSAWCCVVSSMVEGLLLGIIESRRKVKYVFHSLFMITPLEDGAFANVFTSMAERLECFESRSWRSRVVKGTDFESGLCDIRWMGDIISPHGGVVLGVENIGDESGGL
jgi:hypothetical protein